MALYGFAMGPAVHYWYHGLDKVFCGRSLVMVVRKILSDQLIASPTFIVTFFIGTNYLAYVPRIYNFSRCSEIRCTT